MIFFDQEQKSFILQTPSSTYIIKILKDKYLAHIYWGAKIKYPIVDQIYINHPRGSFSANPTNDLQFSSDAAPFEYPAYGNTDLRSPAYQIELENGTRITDLTYDSYRIISGKPKLSKLPSIYAGEEAQTLEITLVDSFIGLQVILSYTILDGYDAVMRSVEFKNLGTTQLKLLRAFSTSIDFKEFDFDLFTLSGSWGRERHIIKRPLNHGCQSIESRRGASGHSENPFFALARKQTSESVGEVYGFSLIYSGNFYAGVEVEQYGTARAQIGINSFDFSWILNPSESFTTPEAVLVYSKEGFGGMSRTYHSLYLNHLVCSKFKKVPRPVLINNWEGTYFDFNEEKIKEIAYEASKLGMELFVLDDGWFGKRKDDTSSLGDWFVNREKLPNGLDGLANAIESYGLKFGLWFEPEMISPDSELYRAHPDWCLHVPNRSRSTARSQLILDYSREDVKNAVISMLTDILSSAKISYVKWDMNRNMSEIGSVLLPANRQAETAHRYILGVYEVMDILTHRFPDILFESCSGGGGRFDPGILYYMPQTWTSDNTDAAERLKIQYGTSLVYPTSAMTAHVSAVPNHQTGRITSLKFRGEVAMAGNFGYELDITKMSEEEKKEVKAQIALYKEIRELIQFGNFYRLLSPFDGNDTAWMYVTQDKKKAVVFYYLIYTVPNESLIHVKLDGLNPDYNYRFIDKDNLIISGEQLMNYGINTFGELNKNCDYQSIMWRLCAEENNAENSNAKDIHAEDKI